MKRRMDPMMIVMIFVVLGMAFRSGMGSFSSPMDWVMEKVYILPGILVGLSFHEFAHARMAQKLGDDTAARQGRVTINPAAHLDVIGFLSLLVLGFGWGVPVPVDERNFKKPRRDNILVSLAGVAMNLLIAVVFSIILKIIVMATGYYTDGLPMAARTIVLDVIVVNLVLMIFNLMPIPPLDGFNLITEIFNLRKYDWWITVYRNSYLFLAAFIVLGISGRIISPVVNWFLSVLFSLL